MADAKVSDLISITSAESSDVLYIVDASSSASRKITFNNLVGNSLAALETRFNLLSSNSSIVLSGSITANTDNIARIDSEMDFLSGEVDNARTNFEQSSDLVDKGFTGPVTISGTLLTFLSGVLTGVN
jgi:uncharacterized membrane protein